MIAAILPRPDVFRVSSDSNLFIRAEPAMLGETNIPWLRGAGVAKPKLIFVNRFFYPDESATSQLLTDLCQHLAARGWSVQILTSNRTQRGARLAANEVINRVQVARVWTSAFGRAGSLVGRAIDYGSFYCSAFLSLLRMLGRGDTVIVKTDPPLISVVAAFAARLKGARLINWCQDLYPEVAIVLGVGGLTGHAGRALKAVRNAAIRQAEANVVIGSRMAELLVNTGASRGSIHIIPNWADDKAIVPVRREHSRTRRRWGIPDHAFVIGYSGNLGRAHETETILRAAALLTNHPHIVFLFIGAGTESEKLRKAVHLAGFDNFLFKPHQRKDALGDALAAADVHWLSLRPTLEGLIVPSKFYGIAAAGRPIIAVVSPTGEIAEVVTKGECGIVVQPGDAASLAGAIVTLAGNHELRQRMGRQARELVDRKFARRHALRRWEDLLRGLTPANESGPETGAGSASGRKRDGTKAQLRAQRAPIQ